MALTRLPMGTGALFLNPGTAEDVQSHLFASTGMNLELGKIQRLNQATTAPTAYLADKEKILNAIVRGSDVANNLRFYTGAVANNEAQLALKLPGINDRRIPEMTSLVTEWQNIYNNLVAQGVTTDIAKLSADQHAKLILGSRLAQFSLSFPGLVDDAFTAGQNLVQQQHETNARGVGLKLEGQTQHVQKRIKTRKHRVKKTRRHKRGPKITEIQ